VLNFSTQERWHLTEAPARLVPGVPGCVAELTSHGLRLPPLGFAVLDRMQSADRGNEGEGAAEAETPPGRVKEG
jgi:hypothetical protein